jgi:hypothetical protein
MASQVDYGFGTGVAQLAFAPGDTGQEIHVAVGANPLPPSGAPYVDPSVARLNVTGGLLAPVSTTTAAGVVFANPAILFF